MMKQKWLKIMLKGFLLIILVVLGWFANAFWGNPISYLLASKTAETHLATTYPNTDFYIDHINYSFKDGKYHAFVKSPSSIDTEFSLYITMLGELRMDTYENVLNGFNTARRLDSEYRALTDLIFDDTSFPYDCHIGFGELEIYSEAALQDASLELPSYAINQNQLVLDKIYDISALGKQAGHLVFYINNDTVNAEQAASIMVDIKNRFDYANVPFAAMSFVLQYPSPKEGPRPTETISVSRFLYEDIYEDRMTERVVQADKELKEHYAKLDAMEK